MLAKKFRLSGKVFVKSGKKHTVYTPLFLIKISENELPYNRYGIIVSKKIDKRSVVRNKLKRMISDAIMRLTIEQSGKDMLFIVKRDFSGLSQHELQEQLKALWYSKA